MADVTKTVAVRIKGDAESLKGATVRANRAMKKLRTIGIAALAAISYAAVKLVIDVVQIGAQFEYTMAQVGAISNSTAQQLELVSQKAREIGAATAFTASQAGQGFILLARAGYDANQQIAAIDSTMLLAGATATDLGTATSATVASLSQFNLAVTESGRVADVFAAAASNSLFTVEGLAQSMKFGGTTAGMFKISIEEATAAQMMLRNVGLEAGMAGRTYSMALAQMTTHTDKHTGILEKLGLTYEDINPQVHSFGDIIGKLAETGIDPATYAMDLFGRRAGRGMGNLIQKAVEGTNEFDKFADTLKTSGGTAATMYGKMMDTVMGRYKIMGSAFQEIKLSLFDLIKGPLTSLLEIVTSIAQFMGRNLPVMIIVAIAAFAAMIPLLIGMMGSFAGLTAAVTAFGVALHVAMPWMIAITAAMGLAAGAYLLLKDRTIENAEATLRYNTEQKQEYENMLSAKKAGAKLAEEYTKLAGKQNRSTAETERMNNMYQKVKKSYPDLISGTDNLSSRLGEMNSVVKNSGDEMKVLKYQIDDATEAMKWQQMIISMQKAKDETKKMVGVWGEIGNAISIVFAGTESEANEMERLVTNLLNNAQQALETGKSAQTEIGLLSTLQTDLWKKGQNATGKQATKYKELSNTILSVVNQLKSAENIIHGIEETEIPIVSGVTPGVTPEVKPKVTPEVTPEEEEVIIPDAGFDSEAWLARKRAGEEQVVLVSKLGEAMWQANLAQKTLGITGREWIQIMSAGLGVVENVFSDMIMLIGEGTRDLGQRMKDIFSNAGKSILKILAQIASKMAVMGIVKLLFGGATGGFGALVMKAAGFQEGGYTGAGREGEPAGVVHKGEYVVKSDVVRQPGMLEALEQINSGNNKQGTTNMPINITGLSRDARSQYINDLRPGGSLYEAFEHLGGKIILEGV